MIKEKKVDPISEYSIFKPRAGRQIKLDYPELNSFPVFQNLRNDEMLFVWYYACEASPIFRMLKDRDRVDEALKLSFFRTRGTSVAQDLKEQYLAGNFPPKILDAINEMSKFKIGPRIRAKMIIEKSFDNIEKILDVDASDDSMFMNKDKEVDFTKKKAFVDTVSKAMDILPSLIKQLEGNFSLVEDKKTAGDIDTALEGRSLIDEYHEKN